MSMADDVEDGIYKRASAEVAAQVIEQTTPVAIAKAMAEVNGSPVLPEHPEFDEEYAILLIRAKDGRFARTRLIRWLKDGTSKTYRICNPAEALVLIQVNRVAYAHRQFDKLEAAEVEAQRGLQS